jgi:hypothetical protein
MAFIFDDRSKDTEELKIKNIKTHVGDFVYLVLLENNDCAMIDSETKEVASFKYQHYLVSDDFQAMIDEYRKTLT